MPLTTLCGVAVTFALRYRAAIGFASPYQNRTIHAFRESSDRLTFKTVATAWVMAVCLPASLPAFAQESLNVGSKRFTESYILGEIVAQTAAPHARVVHRQGLGNTAIVFEALKTGAIDLYPEYLGTLDREILKNAVPASLEEMNRALATLGLRASVPLGFSNGYALAMRAAEAQARGLRRLSDLQAANNLKFGLSHEFLGRADGWPGLVRAYRLSQKPRGLDHGIAYEALAQGQVDVIDIYTTDAKIARLNLTVLADDRAYFPRYDAVLVHRLDLPTRRPAAWRALAALEGRIDSGAMIAMNAAAELDGKAFGAVARDFLTRSSGGGGARAGFIDKLFGDDFWRLTTQHLFLVIAAVGAAVLLGVPLGVVAARQSWLRGPLLGAIGVLQTIPSLALLAMMIPLLGRIGTLPALIALALYALLPIVQNTCTGLMQAPRGLALAALALGLHPRATLIHVELPLAAPVIAAGVKTAAVTAVGTATIAAFIGAGGYGERIATGLALNDHATLLAGAIPAALLAVLTQALFALVERTGRRPGVGGRTRI